MHTHCSSACLTRSLFRSSFRSLCVCLSLSLHERYWCKIYYGFSVLFRRFCSQFRCIILKKARCTWIIRWMVTLWMHPDIIIIIIYLVGGIVLCSIRIIWEWHTHRERERLCLNPLNTYRQFYLMRIYEIIQHHRRHDLRWRWRSSTRKPSGGFLLFVTLFSFVRVFLRKYTTASK